MFYLVTGVSRGLGPEIARELLRRDHRVVGIARTPPPADLLAHPQFRFAACDLKDRPALERWLAEFTPDNAPDRIVLNAADLRPDFGPNHFDLPRALEILETNLTANLVILNTFLPIFGARKRGAIWAVNSLSAIRGIGVRGIAYASSKAALGMSMEALRLYGLPPNVTATTLYLGRVRDPGKCARKIVKAADSGRAKIFLPRGQAMLFFGLRWVPDFLLAKLIRGS